MKGIKLFVANFDKENALKWSLRVSAQSTVLQREVCGGDFECELVPSDSPCPTACLSPRTGCVP